MAAWRKSERHFRRLLEKLPAGAYTCDPDGLITYFNEHAVQLWGRAPKLNDPVDRLCGSFKLFSTDGDPIDHDRCWMALALIEEKEYKRREIVIERPAGDCVMTLAHAKPIHDDTGTLLGAVNVLVELSLGAACGRAARGNHQSPQRRRGYGEHLHRSPARSEQRFEQWP